MRNDLDPAIQPFGPLNTRLMVMPAIFARIALPVATVFAYNRRTDHAAADDPGGRAGSSRRPYSPPP